VDGVHPQGRAGVALHEAGYKYPSPGQLDQTVAVVDCDKHIFSSFVCCYYLYTFSTRGFQQNLSQKIFLNFFGDSAFFFEKAISFIYCKGKRPGGVL
jgi:hypothetical protein